MDLDNFLNNIKINIILKDPFIGSALSYIDIKENNESKTRWCFFNHSTGRFVIEYNYEFLSILRNLDEVVSIFKHEVLHILNNHFSRTEEWEEKNNKKINLHYANIAMDLSINQYIDNLPSLALKPEDFSLPRQKDFETYYKMLTKNIISPKKQEELFKNQIQNKIKENFSGGISNKKINENLKEIKELRGKLKKIEEDKKRENNPPPIEDTFKKLKGIKNKIEEGEDLNDEYLNELKNIKLDEHQNFKNPNDSQFSNSIIKNIVKNIIDNSYNCRKNSGSIPSYVSNLKSLQGEEKKINWKKIVKQFIEKSVISNEKEETWYKLNKRFKDQKGKRKIKEIDLLIRIDTSGSIKKKTIKDFITQLFSIEKNLNPTIIYFHEEVYNSFKKTDLKNKEKVNNIEIGGTFFQPIFDYAKKNKFKNLIIMTDGFGERELVKSFNIRTLWIDEKLEKILMSKKSLINVFNIFKQKFKNINI